MLASAEKRREIFYAVRDAGITGFTIVSGDRHSFWAGYAAKELPPGKFEPVGVTFVGGSITSPGMQEAWEHGSKDNPMRPLFIADREDGRMEPTMNLLLHHGVCSALEYARSGDLAAAHAVRNPEMSPHLTFVDMGGHGYSTVQVDGERMVTEFVCIPRPIERSAQADGGPLRYRMRHIVPRWRACETPRMQALIATKSDRSNRQRCLPCEHPGALHQIDWPGAWHAGAPHWHSVHGAQKRANN